MQLISPVIILDRPQMGENIGAAARAMMNFGLSELRLVAPRDGWPNEKAHEMSAHADWIIEAATVYPNAETALADCHCVIACSGVSHRLALPVQTPEQAAAHLHRQAQAGARTGLLFGRESSGLDNADIALAQAICTIPAAPAMTSLNLAQAVVILGYEWWLCRIKDSELSVQDLKAKVEDPETRVLKPESLATSAEREGLYKHLIQSLDAANYFRNRPKVPKMQQNLRTLLARLPLSTQEIRSLRGMIRALSEHKINGK